MYSVYGDVYYAEQTLQELQYLNDFNVVLINNSIKFLEIAFIIVGLLVAILLSIFTLRVIFND